MLPISVKGDMVDNGTLNNQTYYPSYENGGSFFHSAGFEIAARAVAGDPGMKGEARGERGEKR